GRPSGPSSVSRPPARPASNQPGARPSPGPLPTQAARPSPSMVARPGGTGVPTRAPQRPLTAGQIGVGPGTVARRPAGSSDGLPSRSPAGSRPGTGGGPPRFDRAPPITRAGQGDRPVAGDSLPARPGYRPGPDRFAHPGGGGPGRGPGQQWPGGP